MRALYTWGSGGSGLLCHGNDEDLHEPLPVKDSVVVGALAAPQLPLVATGGVHAFVGFDARDAEGHEFARLAAAGEGADGQLGTGGGAAEDEKEEAGDSSETRACSLRTLRADAFGRAAVTRVACGWRHSAAISADGTLFTWGYGADGQLGHGASAMKRHASPTRVDSLVELGVAVTDVACGYTHTLVASSARSGEVYGCGSDRHGQLAVGSDAAATGGKQRLVPAFTRAALPDGVSGRVTTVCCGWQHSAALLETGSLLTWGNNRHGQCARPPSTAGGSSVAGGAGGTGGETSTGRAPRRRTAVLPERPSVPDSLTTIAIAQVDTGWHHFAALTREGRVLTWGRGGHGQLGDGTLESRGEPREVPLPGSSEVADVACGSEHCCAVRRDGTLWMWGWNEHGNLGLGDCVNRTTPTQVPCFGATMDDTRGPSARALRVATAGAAVFVIAEVEGKDAGDD